MRKLYGESKIMFFIRPLRGTSKLYSNPIPSIPLKDATRILFNSSESFSSVVQQFEWFWEDIKNWQD